MRTPYDPNLHEQAPRAKQTYDEDDPKLISQWNHWLRETLLGKVMASPKTNKFRNAESKRMWTQLAIATMVGAVRSAEFIQVTNDNHPIWRKIFHSVWQKMPMIYAPDEIFKGQKEPWFLHVLHNLGGATYGNPSLAVLLEVALEETNKQRQQDNKVYKDNTNPMDVKEFDFHEQIGKALLDLWVESLTESKLDMTDDGLNDWTGLVNLWREQYNEPGNRFDYLLKHATMIRQLLVDAEQQQKVSPAEKQLQEYCQSLPELPVMRTREVARLMGRNQPREWYATTEIIFASYLSGRFSELIDTSDKKALIEKITRERAQGGVSLLPIMNKMLDQMEKYQGEDPNYLWWRKIGLEAALEQEQTTEKAKPASRRL